MKKFIEVVKAIGLVIFAGYDEEKFGIKYINKY